MALLDEKIELVDRNAVVRIRLGVDDSDRPYLSLNDSNGRERFIASLDDDGNGSLAFRTSKGQPTVTLGVSSDHGSGMMILDVANEICLTLDIANASGLLRLETKEGVYSWPARGTEPE